MVHRSALCLAFPKKFRKFLEEGKAKVASSLSPIFKLRSRKVATLEAVLHPLLTTCPCQTSSETKEIIHEGDEVRRSNEKTFEDAGESVVSVIGSDAVGDFEKDKKYTHVYVSFLRAIHVCVLVCLRDPVDLLARA